MIIALLGTRPTITVLRKRKLGQQVRTGNAPAHQGKSGTPTMGGIVIIIASLIGYVAGHLFTGDPMTASGLLVLFLMTGLGLVGFIDVFIKLFMREMARLTHSAYGLGWAIGRYRNMRSPCTPTGSTGSRRTATLAVALPGV